MKRNLALIAVLMLSLLVAGSAFAGSDTDRVTGGGQILVGTGGAGTTIAFNARGSTTDADGQVQYIVRNADNHPQGKGTGQGQVVRHGVITCLEVTSNNTAEMKGTWTKGATGDFQVFVTDKGQGQDPDDTIIVENAEPDVCNPTQTDDTPPSQVDLARGNVQVYNAS